MREELFCYTDYFRKKHIYKEGMVGLWILLGFFLLLLMIIKIWAGLVILCMYLILYFCTKKETEKQTRMLLNVWLFVLFVGIECSALLSVEYGMLFQTLIMVAVLTVGYEIFWLIGLKIKAFSKKTKYNKAAASAMTPMCVFIGVIMGRRIVRHTSTEFSTWLMVIFGSIMIVGAITYFQKYLVYKILKKSEI